MSFLIHVEQDRKIYDYLDDVDIEQYRKLLSRMGLDDLVWMYDCFEAMNEMFFGKNLPYPYITKGLMEFGKCVGYMAYKPGAVPKIQIFDSFFGGKAGATKNPKWYKYHAVTTLCHEMIHVAQQLPPLAVKGTSHNCESWVDACNDLSSAWDLPRACKMWKLQRQGQSVARRPERNPEGLELDIPDLTVKDVNRWPHGIAEHVHKDLSAWATSCIKRLGLPQNL